ncbi:MAG: NADH-quinone oxidoreductase subunit H [Spirochaetales bacterium]|uniref:NADH-quinone oxidoreductase subunit H n=1 Tax=Candidatus Thalassospirochaeta sargassi TaxID=3119039 RepID=A0AAJ1MIY9_9SPIO|nr:NADH-quinone oxidoreductase subunit H [Spirochaetales bacterium]
MIINICLSIAAALVLSPLLGGIINKTKAFYAGRKGSPVLQLYFDLFKLFRKESVISTSATFIFQAAPAIIFTSTLAATIFVPFIPGLPAPSFTCDFILLFYLLGLSRFFLIISALDTGSSFEGMGASREAFFSALAEPVTFVTILTMLRLGGGTSIQAAFRGLSSESWIIIILTAVPFFIVMLAENARIPFDDPNTHLELTMIHEVMLLDNSGANLALMEWAASIKLWLFSLIIVKILLPAEILTPAAYTGLTILAVPAVAVITGTVESVMARASLLKVPQLLFSAGIIAFLGFFLSLNQFLGW